MPFLAAIPWLIPAITAGSAAAGIGSTIYNDVSKPGAPAAPPPATASQNVAAEVAKRQNEGAMVANQTPNLVANTSGGLSDQAYQTFGSESAGTPGQFGQGGVDLNSIMQFLGGGNSGGGGQPNVMNIATGPSITG